MIRYRLYTENKNLEMLRRLFMAHFQSFNYYMNEGVWHGGREPGVTFEVITANPRARRYLAHISHDIKQANKQEAILITAEPVEAVTL